MAVEHHAAAMTISLPFKVAVLCASSSWLSTLVLAHVVILNTKYRNGSPVWPAPTVTGAFSLRGFREERVPATARCCTYPECIFAQWSSGKRDCDDYRFQQAEHIILYKRVSLNTMSRKTIGPRT
jgi:hypothetical protein